MVKVFRLAGVFVLVLPLFRPSASAAQHKARWSQFDAGSQPAVVMINGGILDPAVLKVKQGTTVEWINNNGQGTVDATGNGFQSGVLKPGDNFRYTFDKRGTYHYRCRLQDVGAEIPGTIVVTK